MDVKDKFFNVDYLSECLEIFTKRKFPYREILMNETPGEYKKSCEHYVLELLRPELCSDDQNIKYVMYLYSRETDFGFNLHINKDKKVVKVFERIKTK